MIRYNVAPDRASSQRTSTALLKDSSIVWLGLAIVCTVVISGLLIVYKQSSPQSLRLAKDHASAHVPAHAHQQGGQDVIQAAAAGKASSIMQSPPAGQTPSMRGSSSLIAQTTDTRPITIMKTRSSVIAASYSSPPPPSLVARAAEALTVTRGSKCSLSSVVQICSHRSVCLN